MTKTHTGTIAEALARSISELRRLVATVGPETPIGKALMTLKIEAQRVQTGLPMRCLSMCAAIDRVRRDGP